MTQVLASSNVLSWYCPCNVADPFPPVSDRNDPVLLWGVGDRDGFGAEKPGVKLLVPVDVPDETLRLATVNRDA